MIEKRNYIINELMVDQFIENESELIRLEETEDTGKSILEIRLDSAENLSIKNVDKKPTQMLFFVNTKEKCMFKRVDHILFQCLEDNNWRVHLIEMKSSIANDKWKDVKGKFRASYLFVQSLAAMLEMDLVETRMYTTYERACFRPSETKPVERRLLLGEKHIKPEDEWSGKNFGLNFGTRIKFMHVPIKMARNKNDILEGRYVSAVF